MLDSVIESDEKYYPQTFQKNANMYKKKKKKLRTILMKNQTVTLIMMMKNLKYFNTIKA